MTNEEYFKKLKVDKNKADEAAKTKIATAKKKRQEEAEKQPGYMKPSGSLAKA